MRFPGLSLEGTLSLSGRAIAMVLPPGIRTELDTDLQLDVTSDDAVLSGPVTVRRGDYRERVNTAGGLLALLESRREPALTVGGPSWAETLTTTMQSSSGKSESDIVSLLLTGRTLDDVGSAPGAVARDQVFGLVSGEVLGVAGRSVGIDTVRLERGISQGAVRVDSSLVAGDTNPGTRLTVGQEPEPSGPDRRVAEPA